MSSSNSTDCYLICATPRSGSTLLCGLLSSTGLAGRPASYFRVHDEQSWADRWRIRRDADGRFDYRDYLRAAVAEGRTDNGMFAARVMWGTLGELIVKLAVRDTARSDLAVLTEALGRIRFVYLVRSDTLGQAVSWVRAEQTQFWQHGDPVRPGREPTFDALAISACMKTIDMHNAAWRAWFSSVDVQPHVVTYENTLTDMAGATRGILEHLGLDSPAVEISPRHTRLGDDVNADWIKRFRELSDTTDEYKKDPAVADGGCNDDRARN